MVYRAVSTLIVLFWVFMMGLLIRRSLFSEQTVLAQVPYETVLRAVLKCTEQPTLIIRDHRHRETDGKPREIGQWRLQVGRVQRITKTDRTDLATGTDTKTSWEPVPASQRGEAAWASACYFLSNDLTLDFSWDGPFRLGINTQCYLEPNLDLISFDCSVRLGEWRGGRLCFLDAFRLSGDRSSGKIQIKSELPGLTHLPPFLFAMVKNANGGQLLGLGSLPNQPFLARFSSSPVGTSNSALPHRLSGGRMICHDILVAMGNEIIRSYVMEIRDGNDWRAKIYVSHQGEIWKVKIPFDIEMETEQPHLLR